MRRLLPLLLALTATTAAAQKPAPLPSDAQLMGVPVSALRIKNGMGAGLKNPLDGDPAALAQGERLFGAMNCVGCHAALGGGGMGPPLSDDDWIYGGEPAQLYLSIAHGRPNGMPAWGGSLPPQSIWSLVAYVKSLSGKAAALPPPASAPK